jgi:ketosteroid isomerase-like protein
MRAVVFSAIDPPSVVWRNYRPDITDEQSTDEPNRIEPNRIETDEAAARRVFDRRVRTWMSEDVDGYLDCWTDDMEIVLPRRDEPVQGKQAYRELVTVSLQWAKPVSFDIDHLAVSVDTVSNNTVLTEWRITVERRSDGRKIRWSGMAACEFEGERIRRWREYHLNPPA